MKQNKNWQWVKRIFRRDSITGRFVTKKHLEENPDTTQEEVRKIGIRKTKKDD